MAHPYSQHKEVHAGQKRAKEMAKHFKTGGAVKPVAGAKALKRGGATEAVETKASGGAVTPRLDKLARGGKAKHHTHINIMVAPKGGDGAPPPGLGAGGPPMGGGAPPMVPKAPMGPPPGPGGPMGAGPPGLPPGMPPKPPGVMKRGGRAPSGIASKANIEAWGDRTTSNTKYESGGRVELKYPHLKGGAGGATARVQKAKAYGIKHKGG